eukprot:scaffold14775_cov251-Skeletonema_menzelii.AAC.1
MDSSSEDDDSSSDSASEMTSVAKVPLALDPDEVRGLAASTGCQELLLDEQDIDLHTKLCRRSNSSLRYAATSSSNDHTLSFDTTQTTSEDEEDLSINNSLSSSREEEGGNYFRQHEQQSPREREHILSFLAFDPLSVEQLAAEVDNGKKKSINTGVARVDVYCLSGTVIVSRMIAVGSNDSTLPERINIDGDSSDALESSTNDSTVESTQIRRIIRQNVTKAALRGIFSNPPNLTTIDESIRAPIKEEEVNENNHLSHDELARVLMGVGGDDLERVMELDSFDYDPPDAGKISKLLYPDQLLALQNEVRKKIAIADIGLAILMGEKEKLEKMMGVEKEEERRHDMDESLEEDAVIPDEDDNNSVESESSRSVSCDVNGGAEERAHQSRYERIRIMGCEVEYSFASDLVDDLEAALMGKSNDDSSDSDDSCYELRRGRSKTKRRILPGEIIPMKRQLRLSAIVAIPTNGDGCIVLRQNGAFNVVGYIPKVLEEQLFKDDAPFPKYISLGSNDRYFVKFDDDLYCVHGPASLTRALNVKMAKKKKFNGENGAKNSVSIASVAFGKDFNAFFVVFTDGSWECDGELHDELDTLLTDRGNRADLVWVSLGPDNQFCLKAKNGRIWWGGVSEEIGDLLFDITDGNKSEVDSISFGVDESFFLTYREVGNLEHFQPQEGKTRE